MNDLPRHKGMRNKLVKLLISKGITDSRVLKAIQKIPRHLFLNSSFEDYAYQDQAFPISSGQTISQPYTVAFQTELLEVEPGMKVLEIGTGSGYQAAVLHELGTKVYSIERQKKLFDITRQTMLKLGYHFQMKYGDGFAGMPTYAPFQRIIITCGAPHIPQTLVDQLEEGGRMVIPVGEGDQKMTLVEKLNNGKVKVSEHGNFRFVPMLGDRNN